MTMNRIIVNKTQPPIEWFIEQLINHPNYNFETVIEHLKQNNNEQSSITQRHHHHSPIIPQMDARLPENDWDTLHYERGHKDV